MVPISALLSSAPPQHPKHITFEGRQHYVWRRQTSPFPIDNKEYARLSVGFIQRSLQFTVKPMLMMTPNHRRCTIQSMFERWEIDCIPPPSDMDGRRSAYSTWHAALAYGP